MPIYVRHEPEKSPLYQVIARSWPGISLAYSAADEPVSDHIESEFKRYVRCGILQYGFVRLKCPSCQEERVVGYSCKCRGFCASCGTKRMEQTAQRLEGEVWPAAGARQWVLTFPHQVRQWLLRDGELFSAVISEVNTVVSWFYELETIRGQDTDLYPERAHGAVTFVQRFGSSLAANPHLHLIALDGVFARTPEGKRFFPYKNFESSSVILVLSKIVDRLTSLFRSWGYVTKDGEPTLPEGLDETVPLPFKPRAPKAYRRRGYPTPHPLFKQTDPNMMSVESWCNVRFKWFSLHAAVVIKGDDRAGLQRLFRYTSRSSVSPSRVTYADPDAPETSEVDLALKRPWSDGSTSLRFSQVDFTERLASVIPPPWRNLVRYSGVFATGHAWRWSIVPGPKKRRVHCDNDPPVPTKPSAGRAPAEYVIPWAELLRRSLGIDPELCTCGARMRMEDSVTDAETISEVMIKMGLSATPPPLGRKARVASELDYLFEEG